MTTAQNTDVPTEIRIQAGILADAMLNSDRAETIDDLVEWFETHLPDNATVNDVKALASTVDLGRVHRTSWQSRLQGKIFGVPYNLTLPTPEKVAHSLWDPTDPQLLRAHVFGIGWAPNFGAVAVRLGLIEPDAEDVPFANTTSTAFKTAAVLPVASLGYGIYHMVRQADRSASTVTGMNTATTALLYAATAAAAFTTTRSSETARNRAGTAAIGTTLAAAIIGTIPLAVHSAPRRRIPLGVALEMGLETGGILWILARSGRAAEIRHDLHTPRPARRNTTSEQASS